MTTLYSQFGDQDSWVYQPQLTRWRFAHRSPMSSLRFNQEQSQFHYDMAKLYSKNRDLETRVDAYFSDIRDGNTYEDLQIHWEAGDELENIDLISIEEIGAGLQKLLDRLEAIEKDL